MTPSLLWIPVGVLVTVVCVGIGSLWFLKTILRPSPPVEQFLAPGQKTVTADAPGSFMLWHDSRTWFRGKRYETDPQLPEGISIAVTNSVTGWEVPRAWTLGSSEQGEDSARSAVGRYVLPSAGEYLVTVSGIDEPRVFAFGRSRMGEILTAFLCSVILNLAGWFGGPAIIITVMARRLKRKRELEALENASDEG